MVNELLFDSPAGNVLGIVTATALVQGQDEVIALATIYADKEPQLTLKKCFARGGLAYDDFANIFQALDDIANALAKFA